MASHIYGHNTIAIL